MPGVYTIDATDTTRPNATDEVQYYYAEMLALKSYIQTNLAALSSPAVNQDYNKINQNLIINGGFAIGASAAVIPDRWKLAVVGTATVTALPVAFVFGQSAVPGDPVNYLNCTFTLDSTVTSYAYVEQRVENVRTLSSSQVGGVNSGSLSFWAKSTVAGVKLAIDNYQFFGTGGTPSANSSCTVSQQSITLTTTWTKYTITTVVNDLTGKSLGTSGTDYLGIRFWLSAGTNNNVPASSIGPQSGTVSLTQVQLVPGSVPVPYQYRTLAQEQDLVDRYIQRIGGVAGTYFGLGVATLATAIKTVVAFRARMRATPAVTIGGTVATSYSEIGGTTIAPSALTGAATSNSSALLSATVAGATIGQSYNLTGTATGLITFNAEL